MNELLLLANQDFCIHVHLLEPQAFLPVILSYHCTFPMLVNLVNLAKRSTTKRRRRKRRKTQGFLIITTKVGFLIGVKLSVLWSHPQHSRWTSPRSSEETAPHNRWICQRGLLLFDGHSWGMWGITPGVTMGYLCHAMAPPCQCRRVSPQGKGAAGGYWTDSVLSGTTKRSFPKAVPGSPFMPATASFTRPASFFSSIQWMQPAIRFMLHGFKAARLVEDRLALGEFAGREEILKSQNFTQEFCECSELLKPYGFAWTIWNSMSAKEQNPAHLCISNGILEQIPSLKSWFATRYRSWSTRFCEKGVTTPSRELTTAIHGIWLVAVTSKCHPLSWSEKISWKNPRFGQPNVRRTCRLRDLAVWGFPNQLQSLQGVHHASGYWIYWVFVQENNRKQPHVGIVPPPFLNPHSQHFQHFHQTSGNEWWLNSPAFVHEKTQRRCCLKHGAEKLPIQLKPSSFWQHPLFWLMFESPDVLEYMCMCMCMYIYICMYIMYVYMFIYLCMYDSSTQPRLW